MRNRAMALVTAALLAAPLVMSQGIVATIPFAFIAAGKTLPSGEWSLARSMSSNGAYLWSVENSTGEYRVWLIGNPAYRQLGERASVVFNCYEGRCFLSTIWTPGETGVYFPPTRAERQLLVAGARPRQTVMFARTR